MSGVETQTVRDDIIAAMNQHEQVEPKVEEVIEEVKEEEVEQPSRDAKGKFAKKEEKVETTETETEEVEESEPEEVKSESKRPPQALSAQIKGKWGDIPEDIKNEFIRLETASAKGVASLKQDAHFGRELMEEIRPFEGLIRAAGGTPKTAVRNLLQTAAILQTGTAAQKQNAVLGIMQEYGIQLNGTEPIQEDPYLSEINQLKRQLMEMQQTGQTHQNSDNEAVINQFMNETDERGNLKYPLDDSLSDEFYDEIVAVRRKDSSLSNRQVLEKAYERLSWKVPEIRQTLLQRQQEDAERKRKEKQAQEVAKKQAASVQVKGTSSSVEPKQTDLTVRQLLERQIYGSNGRI